MCTANEIIQELKAVAAHPAISIRRSMAQTGKKAVGCFPIYAPEEVIYAAGLLPVGMWGGQRQGNRSDRYLQSFCCSIMRTNTEQALAGDYDFLSGVVVTAFCDTLKCIMENWKVASPQLHLIPIVYPQNRKTDAGKQYLITELERVRVEAGKIAGREVTEEMLTEACDLYDQYRATMQRLVDTAAKFPSLFDAATRHAVIKASYFMDKKIYTEKLEQLLTLLEKETPEESYQKRVILTGVLGEPTELLELLTANGLQVVADDLAQETRQFRTIAPREGSAFERMAERIAMQDGCAFLYDRYKTRGSKLIALAEKYKADAVIYLQLKFCDPEELDYPIIKKELEEAGIPLLYLEIEQTPDSLEQYRTRVQSFAEMLEITC